MTRSVDLLVLGATIVTARPDGLVIDNGAIAVSGDRIVDIGPRDALEPGYSAARTLAADGALVFAGLVDTHTHLYQTLLKGLGDDLPLMEWLDACTLPSIPHLTPRMCYVAAALGCIESLRSGCTTLFDYMVDHPNADVSGGAPLVSGLAGRICIGLATASARDSAASISTRVE